MDTKTSSILEMTSPVRLFWEAFWGTVTILEGSGLGEEGCDAGVVCDGDNRW